jgi:hypothetical protein
MIDMLKLSPSENIDNTVMTLFNRMDLLIFKEKNIHFVYAPALDLSGYGNNKKEAEASFLITLKTFLEFTSEKKTLESELLKFGWKSDKGNTFRPPFFDELLHKNPYLAEIVREKNFQKRTLTLQTA